MKTNHIVLILIAFAFSSCEKFLELKPVGEKPDTDVLNDANNVTQVLKSSYSDIQNEAFYGKDIFRVNELYSDNLRFDFVIGLKDFQNRNFSIFSAPIDGAWQRGYSAIYRANVVIDAVDKKLFPQENLYNNLKGEALFIRAIVHFELVRLFAQPYSNASGANPGIPIRTIALTPKEAQLNTPRNTVAEVYSQIILDLKTAASLISNSNSGRATKGAANALLSRVYFSMNDFTNAALYADNVINSGIYSLGSPSDPKVLSVPFRGLSTANIFSIENIVGSTTNKDLTYLYWTRPGGLPTLFIDSTLYKQLRQFGGKRIGSSFDNLFIDTSATYMDTSVKPAVLVHPVMYPYSSKFRGPDSLSNAPANVPVIRLAEMYLTRAEANAELGNFTIARADYNAIRAIAGLNADVTTPDGQLRDRIRLERRIELALENDRYHELRRQKSMNIRGFAYNDVKIPRIPLAETNGNPNIQQNEQ